jgi:hypothetical protein
MIEKPPYSKIRYTSIHTKDFKCSSGTDVQAIWNKHGWTPPSEKMLPPPPEKVVQPLRRVR